MISPVLKLARLLLGVGLLSTTAFAQAPANDLYSNAETVSGSSGSLTKALEDIEGAGMEPGEPATAGISGASIWYRWTAATTGAVVFDTAGSEFDTALGVYAGADLPNAIPIEANDNAPGVEDGTSRVSFVAIEGSTYYIAVVGPADSLGAFQLNWESYAGGLVHFALPEFKKFEDEGGVEVLVMRLPDANASVTVNYEVVDGTAVAGEHYVAASGVLTFPAGEVARTIPVQFINNTDTGDRDFTIKLTSVSEGAVLGSISQTTVVIDDDEDAPANDKFANARLLEGENGADSGSNVGARLEAEEPSHGTGPHASVWYKWVAPANGVVVLDTVGSTNENSEPLDTLIAVYTGTTLNALTSVGKNDNAPGAVTSRLSFAVTSGVTYSIAVAGKFEAEGNIELGWSFGAGGRFEFAQADYYVSEKGGTATVTVNRLNAGTGAVTLDVMVEGITAFEDEDYVVTTSLPITFQSGQTSAQVKLNILNDSEIEGDETVVFSLPNAPEGGVLGNITQATLTIDDDEDNPVNDDFAHAIVMDQTEQPVVGSNVGAGREAKEPLHAGAQSFHSVWFKWTPATSGIVTLQVLGGMAEEPLDTVLAVYTGTSVDKLTLVAADNNGLEGTPFSRLNFAAKANTSYYIAFDSIGGAGDFMLYRSISPGALVQFAAPVFKGREGGNATVTVERAGSTTGALSVACAVKRMANDTASAGPDFDATTVPVNFAAGQTRATFTVALKSDNQVEGEETLTVELSEAEGVVVATPLATVLIDDANDDPANDNFANAELLTGLNGQASGDNAGAGTETGEPVASSIAGHTIWYKWVAPSNGQASFTTEGSGAGSLDTVLTVFTGSSLSNLKVVASNNDAADGDLASVVKFGALNGTTYYLCVDAFGPFPAATSLNWSVVTGGTLAFTSGTYRADEGGLGKVEISVVRTGPNASAASVDYAVSSATALDGEDFTSTAGTLHFAPGQTVRSFLVTIINDEDQEPDETFTVALANPSTGSILGEQSSSSVVIFDNDTEVVGNNFVDAVSLEATSGQTSSSNAGASRETGENLPGTLLNTLGGGRTVWFSWKAPTSGQVTFGTAGSASDTGDLDTVMGVYYGSTLANLQLVAESDEDSEGGEAASVTFRAKAGRTYYIVVDSADGSAGNIELSWELLEPEIGPLLVPRSNFKPSITFKESFSEKITGNLNDGFETPATVTINGTIVASTEDVDVASLDETTVVSFSLGNLVLGEKTLGDAPDYLTNRAAKKNLATFPLMDAAEEKTVGSIKFAWDAAKLTVTIVSTNANEYSIVAADYDEGAEPIMTTVEAQLSFAGVNGLRSVYVTGKSSTKTTLKPDESEYYTTSVSVNGKADYTAPVVTFKTPADKLRTTAEFVDVTGSVADDVLLNWDIFLTVNGNDPFTVNAELSEDQKKGNWDLTEVPLEPGINVIRVTATDESGNVGVATRTVVRVVNSPVSIEVVGQGSTKGSFTGTSLEVGKAYSVTATPANGWLFQGWSGDVSAATPKLDFTMVDGGMNLVATFVENPFLTLKGKYNGLVQAGLFNATQTGAFTLDLTPTGGFTGSLNLGAEKVGLKGSFDANGVATLVFPRKGKTPLTLTLQADLASGSDQITGTISDGGFTASIVGDRVVFDPKSNPAPQQGTYTAILPSSEPLRSTEPFGHGFASVVVSPNGSARVVANLADNVVVSFSAQLSKNGVLPVYGVLKNTTLAGTVLFGSTPAEGASGSLNWNRTAVTGIPALDREIGFEAEQFTKPGKNQRVISALDASGGVATVSLNGAGYADEVTQNLTVGTDHKVVVTTTPSGGVLTLSIAANTGTFTGTIRKPGTTKTLNLKGAFLQGAGFGAGYFTDGSASGYIVIEVPPLVP